MNWADLTMASLARQNEHIGSKTAMVRGMIRKPLMVLLICICTNSCVSQKPFRIISSGKIITFEGAIAPGAATELAERLNEDGATSIETIAITSAGGDSSEGIQVGRIIYSRHLNVEVKKYCNSSCAQYIFVAGRNKYVDPGSIVSFHVSPISLYIELSLSGYIESNHSLSQAAAEDISYYNEIGVDPNILVAGRKWLDPICVNIDERYPNNSPRRYNVRWHYAGFVVNAEDIRRAGVHNIKGFWPKSQAETDQTIRALPFRSEFRDRYIESTSAPTRPEKPTPLCGTAN